VFLQQLLCVLDVAVVLELRDDERLACLLDHLAQGTFDDLRGVDARDDARAREEHVDRLACFVLHHLVLRDDLGHDALAAEAVRELVADLHGLVRAHRDDDLPRGVHRIDRLPVRVVLPHHRCVTVGLHEALVQVPEHCGLGRGRRFLEREHDRVARAEVRPRLRHTVVVELVELRLREAHAEIRHVLRLALERVRSLAQDLLVHVLARQLLRGRLRNHDRVVAVFSVVGEVRDRQVLTERHRAVAGEVALGERLPRRNRVSHLRRDVIVQVRLRREGEVRVVRELDEPRVRRRDLRVREMLRRRDCEIVEAVFFVEVVVLVSRLLGPERLFRSCLSRRRFDEVVRDGSVLLRMRPDVDVVRVDLLDGAVHGRGGHGEPRNLTLHAVSSAGRLGLNERHFALEQR